jgi:glycosyltransferase involved in cell wall biosynthesis
VLALRRGDEPLLDYSYGVRILRFPKGKKGIFILRTAPYFLNRVQKVLLQNHYDLVHIYSFRGCSVLPWINRGRNIKWVLDIRTGNISSNKLRANLANWITKIESRAFQEIIINPLIAEKVLSTGTPYTVIPIGADFNRFRPARDPQFRKSLGIQEGELVVVFSSSLEPERKPEIILEAFRLALIKAPHLKLLIVGEGASRSYLEAIAVEKGIADRVLFTGFIPFEEMQKYLAAADIGLGYVPITPQYDLQPVLKTVEYLASGLPVVATRTQGNLIFAKENVNALLSEDYPNSITERIVCLATEPILRKELASRARSSIEEYDWNRIVRDKLLPVYKRVLEAPAPA